MQGINSSSRKDWYKKLEILNVLSLYIYSIMLFAVDNLHYFQINSSVNNINTRYNNQLHVPSVTLSAIHMYYLLCCQDIQQITNWNCWNINDKTVFQSALRKYLLTHVLYSKEQLLTNDQLLFIFIKDSFLYLLIISCISFTLTARYRWGPRSHEQEEPASRFPFAVHFVLILL